MDLTTLQHDVDDGVLVVTLNRPDQLNAFTVTMAEELEWTFQHVNDRDDIRAVIVTGAGARSARVWISRSPVTHSGSTRPNGRHSPTWTTCPIRR